MEAPLEGSVNAQVLRDEQTISLTNTSGRVLGPGTMWLNGRYGREIGEIGLGQTVTYRLASFEDEFGEAFRAGGFWAIEDPDLLVRAEVEEGEGLVGLVVARGKAPE